MTPDDLAAIRARDAELDPDAIYLPESHTDRRALLAALDEANAECARSKAEVDRLTAEKVHFIDKWQEAEKEIVRLRAQVLPHAYDEVAHERARIRAGVEGMVPVMVRKDYLVPDPKWDDMVTRTAVLRIIDGGEAKRGWTEPPMTSEEALWAKQDYFDKYGMWPDGEDA